MPLDAASQTPKPAARTRGAKSSAPSVALLSLPFGVFLGAVVLGAVHRWLGEPLGTRFAGEVWDLSRNFGLMLIAYGPFAAYVQRANAVAASKQATALPPGDATENGMEGQDDHDDGRRPNRRRR